MIFFSKPNTVGGICTPSHKILTWKAFCNLLSSSNSNHLFLINTKGWGRPGHGSCGQAFPTAAKKPICFDRWGGFNALKSLLSENEPTRVMHRSHVALQTLNEEPTSRIFLQDLLDISTDEVARSKTSAAMNLQPARLETSCWKKYTLAS